MLFEDIIQRIYQDSLSTRQQGSKFEKLVKKLLQLAPSFNARFADVYLWSEFSDAFGLAQNDIGIDIMARDFDGKWVAIQCKALEPSTSLALADLKNFLGVRTITSSSGKVFCHISQHLIFHTCKDVSQNVFKALQQAQDSTTLEAKAYGYYDLQELGILWESFDTDDINSLKLSGKKQLREHQKQALSAIQSHFIEQGNTRGKVIMACGTGKSLLAIRTIDSLVNPGEIALFLAPSLALIDQMIKEFFKESLSPSYQVFAVCSDGKVGSAKSEDLHENELCISPTTSPKALAHAINAMLVNVAISTGGGGRAKRKA